MNPVEIPVAYSVTSPVASPPILSVVIPTYNRRETLAVVLPLLANQSR